MGMEIIIIALLVLLLFGGKRMPEVLRDLGKAHRALQRARDEVMDAVTRETTDAVTPKPVSRRETEDGRLLQTDSPPPPADSAKEEGEIPPEYAEFATLPPEENEPPPEPQPTAGEQGGGPGGKGTSAIS